MEDLTEDEKEAYQKEMSKYVRMLNFDINIFKGLLHIGQVGYGVPLDDAYFYFDYPYNKKVDQLNTLVSQENNLKRTIDFVFDGFRNFNPSSEEAYPFVSYRYKYDEINNELVIYSLESNTSIDRFHL